MLIYKDSDYTIIIENLPTPIMNVQLWMSVGSAHEKNAEAGYAHILEHMVFKSKDNPADLIEKMGGEINAYTSLDQTVYHATIHESEGLNALKILAKMIFSPSFTDSDFHSEIQVILEEIKQGMDNPFRFTFQKLFESTFKSHPYSRPVIGFEKTVKACSPSKLKNFWKNNYALNNFTLVVVGQGDEKVLLEKVKAAITPIIKRSKVKRKISPVKFPSPKFFASSKIIKSNFKDRLFALSLPTGVLDAKTEAALDLFSFNLGSGESSLLNKIIVKEKRLAQYATAGMYGGKHNSSFFFTAQLSPGKETEFFTQAEKILQESILVPMTPDQLARAKTNILSESIYKRETPDGLADFIGGSYVLNGNFEYDYFYNEALEQLDVDQISFIVKKTFANSKLNSIFLKPKDSTVKSLPKFDLNKALPKTAIAPLEGKIQKHRIGNLNVIYSSIKHTPMFSLRMVFPGGPTLENKPGEVKILSELVLRGTKKLDAHSFSTKIESLACHPSSICGKNFLILGVDGISSNLSPSLDLFQDLILNPRFEQSEFEHIQQECVQEAMLSKDKPLKVCVDQFISTLFAGHPYGRLNNEETFKSVQLSDVTSYHSKWLKNPVSSVVGTYNEETLSEFFKNLSGISLNQNFTFPDVKITPNKAKRIIESKLEKEQSHIIVGYQGIAVKDSRRFALSILTGILSGMGGRLFLNLREKSSLAYSVSPMVFQGLHGGYMGVHISCSPSKTTEAVSKIFEELNSLCLKKVSKLELDRSKKFLISRHYMDNQRYSSRALNLCINEAAGLGAEESDNYSKNISKVTAEEIQATAVDLFEKQFPIVSIVHGK